MSWITGLAVYFVVWWLCLFVVLPWGVRAPEDAERGTVESAPAKARMWLKAAVTTVLAGVVWIAIWALFNSGWIDFRQP